VVRSIFQFSLVLMSLGIFTPIAGQAQHFSNHCSTCCQTCQQPRPQCVCTAIRPMVETTYRQQQVVTYKDVARTEYRQQAYYETVPVTTYQNVTVDEGSYRKVWVPKLVQKQVPKTGYQQRLSYRTVPYQVTRRVPRISTRLVPQQHVRYVAQQYQTVMARPVCNTCTVFSTPTTVWVPPYTLSSRAWGTPRPVAATNIVATMPPISVRPNRTARREPKLADGPTPDPKFMDIPKANYDAWETVTPKTTSSSGASRFGDYEVAPMSRRPVDSRGASRRSGRFVPAPSAATVWRNRNGVTRR